jgi:hypothetical protein
MEDRVIAHTQPIAWSRNGVLAKHVASYQAFLEKCRYAPWTRHTYVCCVAHLSHWMASTGLSWRQIGEAAINRFLKEHLTA